MKINKKKFIIITISLSVIFVIICFVGLSLAFGSGISNPILGFFCLICYFITFVIMAPANIVIELFNLKASYFELLVGAIICSIFWSTLFSFFICLKVIKIEALTYHFSRKSGRGDRAKL